MDKNELAYQLTHVTDEVRSCIWLELIFGERAGDLKGASYKDVLRVATSQWGVMDYIDLWGGFGSLCYRIAMTAKADVIDSWKDVRDALKYIRFMITPNELNWYPLEALIYNDAEVRGEFAWFLYKAAGRGQDMANLYRYMTRYRQTQHGCMSVAVRNMISS